MLIMDVGLAEICHGDEIYVGEGRYSYAGGILIRFLAGRVGLGLDFSAD
jgi:hypothetical protein